VFSLARESHEVVRSRGCWWFDDDAMDASNATRVDGDGDGDSGRSSGEAGTDR
jgi:hypothetical protein